MDAEVQQPKCSSHGLALDGMAGGVANELPRYYLLENQPFQSLICRG